MLTVNNLEAHFSSKNMVYDLGITYTIGRALKIDIHGMSMRIKVGIDKEILYDGRVVPSFVVRDVRIFIPKEHFHMSVGGDWILDTAQLILPDW